MLLAVTQPRCWHFFLLLALLLLHLLHKCLVKFKWEESQPQLHCVFPWGVRSVLHFFRSTNKLRLEMLLVEILHMWGSFRLACSIQKMCKCHCHGWSGAVARNNLQSHTRTLCSGGSSYWGNPRCFIRGWMGSPGVLTERTLMFQSCVDLWSLLRFPASCESWFWGMCAHCWSWAMCPSPSTGTGAWRHVGALCIPPLIHNALSNQGMKRPLVANFVQK